MIEQVALVRLIPGDGVRLDRSQIEAADEIRLQQAIDQPLIARLPAGTTLGEPDYYECANTSVAASH